MNNDNILGGVTPTAGGDNLGGNGQNNSMPIGGGIPIMPSSANVVGDANFNTIASNPVIPNVVPSVNNSATSNGGPVGANNTSNGVIPVSSSSVIPEVRNDVIATGSTVIAPEDTTNVLNFDLPSNANSVMTQGNVISQNAGMDPIQGHPIPNTSQPVVNDNLTNNLNVGNATVQTNSPSKTTVSCDSNDNIVSVGKYIGYIILFSIPIVGLIMLIVKALDKKDKNISNLARAQLLIGLVVVVLVVLVFVVFGASLIGIASSVNN